MKTTLLPPPPPTVAPKMPTRSPWGHCRSRGTGTITICSPTLVLATPAYRTEMCTFQASPWWEPQQDCTHARLGGV